MHDPRLGRFFAIDPLAPDYPFYSPYAFSGNLVIHAVELEGLEPDIKFESPQSSQFIGGNESSFDKVSYNEGLNNIVMPAASAIALEFAIGELFSWGSSTLKSTKTSSKSTQTVVKSENVVQKSEQSIQKNITPATKAKKAEQLAKNKLAGEAHEKAVRITLEKGLKEGEEILEQVYFKLPNGQFARPDFVIVKNNKVVKIIDAKSGSGKLTTNQKILQEQGGTFYGKSSEHMEGIKIKPTNIEIQ